MLLVSQAGVKLGTFSPQPPKYLGQFPLLYLTPVITVTTTVCNFKTGYFDHDRLVTLEMEPKASNLSG